MSQGYNQQTRKILEDFLTALGRKKGVDPQFLAELRAMIKSSVLDDPGRIRQAIARLEGRADELQD